MAGAHRHKDSGCGKPAEASTWPFAMKADTAERKQKNKWHAHKDGGPAGVGETQKLRPARRGEGTGAAITCQTCIHRLDVTLWGYWLPFGSGALQGLPNTFNSI